MEPNGIKIEVILAIDGVNIYCEKKKNLTLSPGIIFFYINVAGSVEEV